MINEDVEDVCIYALWQDSHSACIVLRGQLGGIGFLLPSCESWGQIFLAKIWKCHRFRVSFPCSVLIFLSCLKTQKEYYISRSSVHLG